MKLPISVCILAKNEEQHVSKCLKSIIPFVNEIVFIDTGSKDKTMEIARQHEVNVLEKSWNLNFSEMRNYAISEAKESFIMMMDADEELSPGSAAALQQICSLKEGQAGRVQIVSHTNNENIAISRITRVFPNDARYCYEGRIHEQLVFQKDKVHCISYINLDIKLYHYGYTKDSILLKNKTERNLQLLLLQQEENSNDSYNLFQLGRTYYVQKEYEEAETYLYRALHLTQSNYNEFPFHSSILATLGHVLLQQRKFEALFKLLQVGVEIYPDYTDLYFIYVNALVQKQDPSHIAYIPEVLQYCLKLGETNDLKYETVKGVGSFQAHYNLGIYFELTGQRELAKHHYEASAAEHFNPAIFRLKALETSSSE
ncbi:glycosyltransferase [Paenibacillus aceris]|uniref:Glycosyltransferase involved in cell wall biosynthesis n=1 Tax=Paenibacillus aceris TaxID=869555 RepID=A0ABS4I4G1_9BACL|nr:glycosyltransferase [Paenibacillus aceris]MBP1965809.1 glycosyltransferase involved in cell wall biosynthesis [Paenibacillus aceris]NHW34845.1 glycosyltransferase [Paenibacillus aceris]